MTVNVGPSGLVQVFARTDLESSDHNAGSASVFLSEATDLTPPFLILGAGLPDRKWTSTQPGPGTRSPQQASWLVLEATPGVHTFSLRYQRGCSDSPCTSAHVASFKNRKLWVAPVD